MVRLLQRLARRLVPALVFAGIALAASGCLTNAGVGPNARVPLETVEFVDLERFMGRWYVIESIGTAPEANAFDAEETYRLRQDGVIDIDFRFREGAFDGPVESIPQTGWVHDEETNAEWRVRPVWPLALDYLIIGLAPDYSHTVIGHPSKRYVWIMARTPSLPEPTLERIRGELRDAGYDLGAMRKVPQRPVGERVPYER